MVEDAELRRQIALAVPQLAKLAAPRPSAAGRIAVFGTTFAALLGLFWVGIDTGSELVAPMVPYSLQARLGNSVTNELVAGHQLCTNPAGLAAINGLANRLAKAADYGHPVKVTIIRGGPINAFTLPGGFLYVNYGVILAVEDEAELAGVMAHEIAHVAARHATRQMTRANMLSLISLPLDLAGGGIVGQAVQLAVGFAKPMEMLKFSRGFEAEADYLGLEYLYAAGYDPQAFISFLERASAEEKNIGKWSGLFSTHPLMTSRIKKGQNEITKILPQRDSYIVNTSQFDEIRAHLLKVASPQKPKTHRRTHDPVLRPRTPGSGSTRD